MRLGSEVAGVGLAILCLKYTGGGLLACLLPGWLAGWLACFLACSLFTCLLACLLARGTGQKIPIRRGEKSLNNIAPILTHGQVVCVSGRKKTPL